MRMDRRSLFMASLMAPVVGFGNEAGAAEVDLEGNVLYNAGDVRTESQRMVAYAMTKLVKGNCCAKKPCTKNMMISARWADFNRAADKAAN